MGIPTTTRVKIVYEHKGVPNRELNVSSWEQKPDGSLFIITTTNKTLLIAKGKWINIEEL